MTVYNFHPEMVDLRKNTTKCILIQCSVTNSQPLVLNLDNMTLKYKHTVGISGSNEVSFVQNTWHKVEFVGLFWIKHNAVQSCFQMG